MLLRITTTTITHDNIKNGNIRLYISLKNNSILYISCMYICIYIHNIYYTYHWTSCIVPGHHCWLYTLQMCQELKGVTAALEVLSSDDAQATFKSAPRRPGWWEGGKTKTWRKHGKIWKLWENHGKTNETTWTITNYNPFVSYTRCFMYGIVTYIWVLLCIIHIYSICKTLECSLNYVETCADFLSTDQIFRQMWLWQTVKNLPSNPAVGRPAKYHLVIQHSYCK